MTDHAMRSRTMQDDKIHYQALDVLDIEELARALNISVRTAERQHFPCVYLGERTKRYVWGQIIDFLTRKAAA